MVEPWKATGGSPSPGRPRPGTIQTSCTARPPSTQPKCSSPVIVAGRPSGPVPLQCSLQEPTNRPNRSSCSTCRPAGPFACSASTSPFVGPATSLSVVTGPLPATRSSVSLEGDQERGETVAGGARVPRPGGVLDEQDVSGTAGAGLAGRRDRAMPRQQDRQLPSGLRLLGMSAA